VSRLGVLRLGVSRFGPRDAMRAGLPGGLQMILDTNTLYLVTIYVEAILGLLLIFASFQNSGIRAVAWWGCAHLMLALSLVFFGTQSALPDVMANDLAHVTLLLAFGVTWNGARVFDGRKPLMNWLVAGPVLWIVADHVLVDKVSVNAGFLAACLVITGYNWLTGFEFWRGRGEALVSRWPAIFMSCAYGSLFLFSSPLIDLLPWTMTSLGFASSGFASRGFESVWLAVLSFQALLFSIAMAFILLAMTKERTELRHRIAAMIDPLTGIHNRRSFLLEADKMRHKQNAARRPVAVLVVDLDQFKSINDRFGHAIGDCVLQTFAKTATETLRAGDLIGRIGGEEFACALYDVDADVGQAVSERLRHAFAEAAKIVEDYHVEATVSIGLVCLPDAGFDTSEWLALADRALYRAKERGRNRVEVATADPARKRATPPARNVAAEVRPAA
jgi:diguanylate cyclase (GGDEF)-like protein